MSYSISQQGYWCLTTFITNTAPPSLTRHPNPATLTTAHYKWNFRLLESISCRLCTHSYSPNFESNVPFCTERSFRVNRGPSSCRPTFLAFRNYKEKAISEKQWKSLLWDQISCTEIVQARFLVKYVSVELCTLGPKCVKDAQLQLDEH